MPLYDGLTPETFLALVAMREHVDAHFSWGVHARSANLAVARAKLVTQFLETTATHLLFCDGDSAFEPDAIARMLDAERGIIGCLFADRLQSDLDGVRIAARACDPEWRLAIGASNFSPESDEPVQEAPMLGTGLLLIQRAVLEHMTEHYRSELRFHDRGLARDRADGRQEAVALFHPMWHPSGQPMGEDTSFRRRAYALGHKFYALLDATTWHLGMQAMPLNMLQRARAHERWRAALAANDGPAGDRRAREES